MLIQIQVCVNQKSKIIFHAHVDGIFQCDDFQSFRVGIVRMVYGIIQLQQFLSVPEEHTEQSAFVLTVGSYVCFIFHLSSFAGQKWKSQLYREQVRIPALAFPKISCF